jgi:hypothetical protein
MEASNWNCIDEQEKMNYRALEEGHIFRKRFSGLMGPLHTSDVNAGTLAAWGTGTFPKGNHLAKLHAARKKAGLNARVDWGFLCRD